VRYGKRIYLSCFNGFAIRNEQQRLPFSNTVSATCLHVATNILTAILKKSDGFPHDPMCRSIFKFYLNAAIILGIIYLKKLFH